MIYIDDPERLAKAGRLLPATRSANVILAEPYDPSLLPGPVKQRGTAYASTAQVVLDSLTGNGDMPAEGERFLPGCARTRPAGARASSNTGRSSVEPDHHIDLDHRPSAGDAERRASLRIASWASRCRA